MHSQYDLEKLGWIRESGFEVNGAPNMSHPCVIIRGVDSGLDGNDVKVSVWNRSKEAYRE